MAGVLGQCSSLDQQTLAFRGTGEDGIATLQTRFTGHDSAYERFETTACQSAALARNVDNRACSA